MNISFQTSIYQGINIKPQNRKNNSSFFAGNSAARAAQPLFRGTLFLGKNLIGEEVFASKKHMAEEIKKAIEILKNEKEHGLFAIGENFSEFIEKSQIHKILGFLREKVEHLVIKNPQQDQKLYSFSLENASSEVKTEIHFYRKGISPDAVLFAIKNNFKSVTFVTDDQIHKLILPKNSEKLTIEAEKAYQEVSGLIGHYIAKGKTKFDLDKSQKMVKNISGAKLTVEDL